MVNREFTRRCPSIDHACKGRIEPVLAANLNCALSLDDHWRHPTVERGWPKRGDLDGGCEVVHGQNTGNGLNINWITLNEHVESPIELHNLAR